MTFNTHEAVKALKSSGFDEKQAEAVVETIDTAVNETVATKSDLEVMAAKMATKDDIKDMATKGDLKALATKDELKALATKDDIKDMATKDDLKGLATKDELKALAKTVEDIQDNINENMATKADLALLKKTVEAESANLETRMMRMMWIQTTVLVGMFITMVGLLAPLVVKLL